MFSSRTSEMKKYFHILRFSGSLIYYPTSFTLKTLRLSVAVSGRSLATPKMNPSHLEILLSYFWSQN